MMAVQKYLIFVFFCTSASYTWGEITCHDMDVSRNTFECALYYSKFEQALLKNSTIIHSLQQVFIQDNPVEKVYLTVPIQVKTKCNQTSYLIYDYTWQQSSLSEIIDVPGLTRLDVTSISSIIISIQLEIPTTANIIYNVFTFGALSGHSPNVSLPLDIDELPCSADNDTDISAALPPFLSWIKAYAKWHGKPDTWDIHDKGAILAFGISQGNGPIQKLLMAGYVFEILLVFVLLLRFALSYYQVLSKTVQRNRTIYSIYWGSGFISVLLNIVSIIPTVMAYVIIIIYHPTSDVDPFIIHYDLKLVGLGLVMCCSIVLLSLLVAIAIVCRSGRRAGVDMSIPTKAAQIFCCCCCCFCCSKNTKSRVFQVFMLWSILIFIHTLVTSTIPLFILIILYPAQTLSIGGIIFSTIFCFIMLAAHLFHFGQLSWYKLCSSMLAILLLLGLVITIILFYIIGLGNGIHTGGVGAVLVSLLPSLSLSAIGWYIKRKFLKSDVAGHYSYMEEVVTHSSGSEQQEN